MNFSLHHQPRPHMLPFAESFPVLAGLLQAQLEAVEDSAAPSCILKSWMSQHQLHAMQARDLYSFQQIEHFGEDAQCNMEARWTDLFK